MFRYIATQSSHCIRGKYAALQSLASLLCDIRPEFGRVMAAPQEGSCDRFRSAGCRGALHCCCCFRAACPSIRATSASIRPSVRPRVGLGRHVRDVRLRRASERASGRRRGGQLSGGKNARTEILACTFAALPPPPSEADGAEGGRRAEVTN